MVKNQLNVNKIRLSFVAERFGVSVKLVKNLLKLYRETGSVTPRPHGGGQTPKISADGLKLVDNTVKTQPDLTIDEYLEIDNNSFDIKVSASLIERALKKLKLTRKTT